MSTNARTPENHTGTTADSIDDVPASYLGTDGEGRDHYWSIYHRADFVVGDDGMVLEEYPLAETDASDLREYVEDVADDVGPWEECRVGIDEDHLAEVRKNIRRGHGLEEADDE